MAAERQPLGGLVAILMPLDGNRKAAFGERLPFGACAPTGAVQLPFNVIHIAAVKGMGSSHSLVTTAVQLRLNDSHSRDLWNGI